MITQDEIDKHIRDNDYIKCNKRYGDSIIKRSFCEERSKRKIESNQNFILGDKDSHQDYIFPFDVTCNNCTYWKYADRLLSI